MVHHCVPCPNFTWLTNIKQNISLSDQDKNGIIFLKTRPDRLNLEMVFDVIDQPTSQSVVCSVFCHYPWKFCNKNTRCERVVLVDAPDYTVESLFWFQLHVISCWSSSRNHFSGAWLASSAWLLGALPNSGLPIHDLPWQILLFVYSRVGRPRLFLPADRNCICRNSLWSQLPTCYSSFLGI